MAGQALVEFALVVPIILLLVVAIGDFARLYTTQIAIQSGAREAADYGAFGSSNWDLTPDGDNRSNADKTIAAMQVRACTAASDLPEFTAGATDAYGNVTCTNPQLVVDPTLVLMKPAGVTDCSKVSHLAQPCLVHVKLHYQFRMLLGGVGIPGLFTFSPTLDFDRDVYYAVSDFPST